ncbi:MAG TPA: magnesium-translocating P-type ATPase [Anaeromyxobacteraceae bacterium]|nr:magnesium-translocating P-type ATPase [Anaeromyxobacteraceae bacterium]
MTAPRRKPAFWQRSLESVLTELRTDGAGLDETEAERRFELHGPNVLRPPRKRALVLEFLSRFGNPLIILLLAAAAISGFTGDKASFIIIEVVIVLSVTLDFVQEYRAGQAADRLKNSVALRTTAIRSGRTMEIMADRIVPGDVVQLEPGELVPADGRVLEARDLFVNQALLTGEPYPVEKRAGELEDPTLDVAAASNAVFMGTSIISGTARLLICRTGPATELGTIGSSLVAKPPATAFETGTRQFGLLILRIAVLMVLFVMLVNGLFHRPWLQSLLFAVALAVGLTPEMLPMVVSVTLSRGALRMARERIIVKRLTAVNDLGSVDVLCTDKTGTLTEARISLQKHLDPLGRDSARVLELAYLNSSFGTGIKNPLDEAILRHAEVNVSGWRKIDEVPFDFERRRVSVLADDGRQRLLILKGAFEDVLQHSTQYEASGPNTLLPLDAAARRTVCQCFESLSREGYRVLGIAWRVTSRDQVHAVVDDETELVFGGFAAFEDPPKPSATEAVRSLEACGVAVKIVTGDNELVTQHACMELGLAVHGVLTGHEIEGMDDAALAARAGSVNLFCRVTPTQKNRVIHALRSRNHVVGYLGDGINDAPSLHSANVGLSVDSAVDVAKEAADLILLGQDLAVIHRGVLEGRRTVANVMKYLMMGTSSNFGSMFSMAGGTLVLPFLPLLPVQILVNNLLYDFSEIPIPTDNVDREFIQRPRSWNLTSIRNFMLVIGPVSSIFDFLTFWVMLGVFQAGEALFHTGWFVESLATQVLVIFVIRTRGNPLHSRPSMALTVTSLATVAIATALPYTPFGASLGFVPLPGIFFLILAAIVLVYLAMVQAVKNLFYRHFAVEWA